MSDPQPDGVTLPTLVMTGGPLDGTSYQLPMTAQDVVLGSSMDADVQIMLGNVEPGHARLSFGSGGLSIADGGSATGTFVNGEKVEEAQVLQDGDRICLGPPGAKDSAKLVVKLPGQAASTDATAPEAPSFGTDAGPLIIDDGEQPMLTFEDDSPGPDLSQPPPAPAQPPPPPAPPAVESPGGTTTGDEILAAEEVVVADAEEEPFDTVALPGGPDSLFQQPAPPPPAPAPPPPAEAPGAAPPPPPPAVEEPPPPSVPEAPPPAPPPPPPLDFDDEPPRAPAAPRPRRSVQGRRPGRRARRGVSIPVVPIAGGLMAALALGAGVWWFFLRANPPVLSSVTPRKVESGQSVTLTGESFATEPAGNTVLFGKQRAEVSTATETSLQVVVPDKLGDAAQVPVIVRTSDGTSQPVAVSLLRNPRITAVQPDVALPGEAVVIRGENFTGEVSVTIGDAAAEVTESAGESVQVVVPDLRLQQGQATKIVVKAGSAASKPAELIIGRLPLLLEITPASGPVGERVVVKGRGFATEPTGNAVTFGGAQALVLSATPNELTVVTPATRAGASPEVPVVVTAGGRASSSSVLYSVTRPTTSNFRPRFFAAPVPEYPGEPLALVSTELAPVILLGGADRAASAAARADEAAQKLNGLVDSAASRPIQIEFRDRPPSVGVAGDVDVLLVATSADASAYGKPWAPGARSGPRISPRVLARHWAAVLQDYFALFMYRQRPLSVLSLSPRGQVFKEIYAEAARRAPSGNGVSTSVVYPTSQTMARDLRLAALVPATGQPREAVAVEGRWRGTLEDPSTGVFQFQVLLRLAGGELTGSFTSWRGNIEARAPLRNISFRQGTLDFTVDLRGTALEFEGTLNDTTITGTARQEGRSPAPFTLQYME